jgi:hypothetical protein
MEQYKAVSQNLMNKSIQVTYSIYGQLTRGDVHKVIF